MTFYLLHELTHAALSPFRTLADMTRLYYQNPLNPLARTPLGRSAAAGCEVFERATRQYGKPAFGIKDVVVDAQKLKVEEEVVWSNTFCNLINFVRMAPAGRSPDMSNKMAKVVLVAPMSGHYSTLLRGTVEGLLPYHDVYITDWVDARQVPVSEGRFDLDDYIDYIISISHFFQGDVHFVAVCQPSVPVLAAIARMEEEDDPYVPKSMTLMGGPIDTRINPTAVNDLAASHDLEWFQNNVIMRVPFPHPGVGRTVYPGFLQLSGFMSMNLDRHVTAHRQYYNHLVQGDGDSAEKHREFYDEYLAVMDLTSEFYLQTVDTVFIRHALPTRDMRHRGKRVDTSKIKRVALFTVEGEKDDISGVGQTEAAHTLCDNLPDDMKDHYVQPSVGHYGVFNGSRFLAGIRPRISDFVNTFEKAPEKRRAKGSGVGKRAVDITKTLKSILVKQPHGAADDLTQIAGVGPKMVKLLNEMGI
ncbi:MAG: polyhydroxyalkanoate depolymerase, partial [Pseudomonadota bacterium]